MPDLALQEKHVVAHVKELAQRFGWKFAHIPYPVRPVGNGKFVPEPDAAGFPDFVLVRGGRLVILEAKGPKGKLRPEQLKWLEAFQEFAHGANAARSWAIAASAEGRGDGSGTEACVDVMLIRPENLDLLQEVLR